MTMIAMGNVGSAIQKVVAEGAFPPSAKEMVEQLLNMQEVREINFAYGPHVQGLADDFADQLFNRDMRVDEALIFVKELKERYDATMIPGDPDYAEFEQMTRRSR